MWSMTFQPSRGVSRARDRCSQLLCPIKLLQRPAFCRHSLFGSADVLRTAGRDAPDMGGPDQAHGERGPGTVEGATEAMIALSAVGERGEALAGKIVVAQDRQVSLLLIRPAPSCQDTAANSRTAS